MKISHGIILNGIAIALISSASGEQSKKIIADPCPNLRGCYEATAEDYGTLSCQPPPDLVGAVFGNCSKIEDACKQWTGKQHPNDYAFPDEVMKRVHAGMTPKIEQIILEAQIKHRKCQ